MIEINLAPYHLRKKKKKQMSAGLPNVPKEAAIGLLGGLGVLLVIVHTILGVVTILKYTQCTKSENALKTIEGEWKLAKGVKQESRILQNKIGAVEKVTTEKRISWAWKLNDISDSVPKGVWLSKLSLDGEILFIDGNAVSKERNEMISAGVFTENLKKQENFAEGLGNIEVSSIQRRNIKSVEIADFLITVRLK